MKKIYLALILSTSLYAAPYTKQEIVKDMQKMMEAMSNIEMGFFYNNKDIVRDNAMALSKTIKNVRPPLQKEEMKEPLSDYVKRKIEITKDIINKIDEKANDIAERFDTKDARASIQAYTSIVKQCMKCHHEIRKW
jgi:cytochrome c556